MEKNKMYERKQIAAWFGYKSVTPISLLFEKYGIEADREVPRYNIPSKEYSYESIKKLLTNVYESEPYYKLLFLNRNRSIFEQFGIIDKDQGYVYTLKDIASLLGYESAQSVKSFFKKYKIKPDNPLEEGSGRRRVNLYKKETVKDFLQRIISEREGGSYERILRNQDLINTFQLELPVGQESQKYTKDNSTIDVNYVHQKAIQAARRWLNKPTKKNKAGAARAADEDAFIKKISKNVCNHEFAPRVTNVTQISPKNTRESVDSVYCTKCLTIKDLE